jgi:hypothetical protein
MPTCVHHRALQTQCGHPPHRSPQETLGSHSPLGPARKQPQGAVGGDSVLLALALALGHDLDLALALFLLLSALLPLLAREVTPRQPRPSLRRMGAGS